MAWRYSKLVVLMILVFQNYGKSDTKCDIVRQYKAVIQVSLGKHEEYTYIEKLIREVDEKQCFAGLINRNRQYADYLLTNFVKDSLYNDLDKIEDSVELNKQFFSVIQQDSSFNAVMSEWIDKTINSIPKDTVTLDQMLNIAIKFFSIELNEKDYYSMIICAGFNQIRKTEPKRSPHLEAFCFSAIFQDLEEENYGILDEFKGMIEQLYKVHLGIDKPEKLLRAQGGIFFMMRNSQILRNLLISEYNEKKNDLPFILSPE
ncbi:MAG: hypothetical protein KBA26_10325 [Candidatus Delongbacteria bacterium]|nr:hypothetical protein [Candidatus Delongbacteria bacterium]